MEKSTQELILESCNGDTSKMIAALSDCFAVLRMEMEAAALSGPAAFNLGPREKLIKKMDEIESIKKNIISFHDRLFLDSRFQFFL